MGPASDGAAIGYRGLLAIARRSRVDSPASVSLDDFARANAVTVSQSIDNIYSVTSIYYLWSESELLRRKSSSKYFIRWLCLWSSGLHTRGFSFDRPLRLRPRALSKLATRVQPVDHAPPSYNIIYIHIHRYEWNIQTSVPFFCVTSY